MLSVQRKAFINIFFPAVQTPATTEACLAKVLHILEVVDVWEGGRAGKRFSHRLLMWKLNHTGSFSISGDVPSPSITNKILL